jgi:ribosomal protein S18 acetylase RimI-like enzyme
VGDALQRAARGEVDYLAVRAPGGFPVCIGGIDYAKCEGAGVLWQLATIGDLQSLGLGTRLILEAEQRIRQRSLATAMLGVEDNNPRARALYERLGYIAYDHAQESWKGVDPLGHVTVYHAEVTLMRKSLT